jgi:hypothetical protein
MSVRARYPQGGPISGVQDMAPLGGRSAEARGERNFIVRGRYGRQPVPCRRDIGLGQCQCNIGSGQCQNAVVGHRIRASCGIQSDRSAETADDEYLLHRSPGKYRHSRTNRKILQRRPCVPRVIPNQRTRTLGKLIWIA